MTSKLLCLCDSPTKETGFARVAQNLIPRWDNHFDTIDVWGIGFEGWPHLWPFRIFPAARYSNPRWHEPDNLGRFLTLLEHGGYTHLWMMQDTFLLAPIAEQMAEICRRKKIRSVLYFPVDAPLDRDWTEILHAVDVPVAYCEYGKTEALRACEEDSPGGEFGGVAFGPSDRKTQLASKLLVIPHGCDARKYFPVPKKQARCELFVGPGGRPAFGEDDFLVINVNVNQRRKGIVQTLEVVKRLGELMAPRAVKLYLHMRRINPDEGCDLAAAARQLGMASQVFFAPNGIWPKGFDEEHLNLLYNAADLLLTTSLGEGWGLPITEAMAAGTPVAGPRHTSVAEIMADGRGVTFKAEHLDWTTADNSRLRPRADFADAAWRIYCASKSGELATNAERASSWVKKLDWDDIAKLWLEVLQP